MVPKLANSVRSAFLECRDMDASLNERLDAFAASVRALNPSFADAVDRLVSRLQKANVGAGAPDPGDLMPPFYLRTRRAALSHSTRCSGAGPSPLSSIGDIGVHIAGLIRGR